MSFLYVTEHGCNLGVNGGWITIKHADERIETIPKELVEGISIFGKSSMTNSCIKYCLENDVKVGFFTSSGKYYGELNPISSLSLERIKKQIKCSENEQFSLEMAKQLIQAKVNNQLVVAKRYTKDKDLDPKQELFPIRNARRKIPYVESKVELLGYEGSSSRCYFSALGAVMHEDFYFQKRTRRPAKDPFNAMLNMGYSLLLKEICGNLENRGLLTCAGFLHSGHDKIPALACDMMEEWRPVIVDSTVLSLIQGKEVDILMFEVKDGCCKIGSKAMKIFLTKLESKMHTETQYLSYTSTPVTFRQALWHQADKMAKAIETGNVNMYKPILLR